MAGIEESVRELWQRNPMVVLGVGGAVVVGGYFLLRGKGAQPTAPAQDNTPVTYQIYGTPGGVSGGGGGGVPSPLPQPLPLPGPIHHCLQGQHWDDATGQCVSDPSSNKCGSRECPPDYLCIAGRCVNPNPDPGPGPGPNPDPGCTYGTCGGGFGDVRVCPDNMRCVNGCCQPPGPPEGGTDVMRNVSYAHSLF